MTTKTKETTQHTPGLLTPEDWEACPEFDVYYGQTTTTRRRVQVTVNGPEAQIHTVSNYLTLAPRLAQDLAALRTACAGLPDPAIVPELAKMLQELCSNIDVWTINNSKRSSEQWGSLKTRARALLARIGKATP